MRSWREKGAKKEWKQRKEKRRGKCEESRTIGNNRKNRENRENRDHRKHRKNGTEGGNKEEQQVVVEQNVVNYKFKN